MGHLQKYVRFRKRCVSLWLTTTQDDHVIKSQSETLHFRKRT